MSFVPCRVGKRIDWRNGPEPVRARSHESRNSRRLLMPRPLDANSELLPEKDSPLRLSDYPDRGIQFILTRDIRCPAPLQWLW
jgi:hypothetical protein